MSCSLNDSFKASLKYFLFYIREQKFSECLRENCFWNIPALHRFADFRSQSSATSKTDLKCEAVFIQKNITE